MFARKIVSLSRCKTSLQRMHFAANTASSVTFGGATRGAASAAERSVMDTSSLSTKEHLESARMPELLRKHALQVFAMRESARESVEEVVATDAMSLDDLRAEARYALDLMQITSEKVGTEHYNDYVELFAESMRSVLLDFDLQRRETQLLLTKTHSVLLEHYTQTQQALEKISAQRDGNVSKVEKKTSPVDSFDIARLISDALPLRPPPSDLKPTDYISVVCALLRAAENPTIELEVKQFLEQQQQENSDLQLMHWTKQPPYATVQLKENLFALFHLRRDNKITLFSVPSIDDLSDQSKIITNQGTVTFTPDWLVALKKVKWPASLENNLQILKPTNKK